MKKKHILLLTPGFSVNEEDTQCIPALQVFVKALNATNSYKISIISLHFPQQNGHRKWFGIDVYDVYSARKVNVFFTAWKWVKNIHKKHQIDLIHSFWLGDAALLGQSLSWLKGIPHLVTLMGQDVLPNNNYLRFFPLKRLNLVALSPFHAKQYKQTTKHEVQKIIPWGLADEDINNTSPQKTIDILGVGNLTALKAFDQFIRIISIVQKQVKGTLRVGIIGTGIEEATLKQLSKDLNLEHIIHFYSNIDRQEVLELMCQSRVLLHTSSYESFGMVFLEALANGACVVSKKVGIAHPHERWFLAETEAELAAQCLLALEKSHQPKRIHLFPIKKTTNSYIQYYKGLFRHHF